MANQPVIAAIDPGHRHCGICVLHSNQVLLCYRWDLPKDITHACGLLRAYLHELIILQKVTVLAFETFTWYRQKGYVQSEMAICNILGVIRGFHGYLPVIEVTARKWGEDLTGQRQAATRDYAITHEWKRITNRAIKLRLQADGITGATLDNDPGYHKSDAVGIALWTSDQVQRERAVHAASTGATR